MTIQPTIIYATRGGVPLASADGPGLRTSLREAGRDSVERPGSASAPRPLRTADDLEDEED